MKRALLIPILIPAIIFAAYMGWSWYQVKRLVDHLNQQVAPFAHIEYRSIDIGLKGEYGAKGLVISSRGQPVASIDSVALTTPDWKYVLTLGTPFERQQLPTSAELKVSGIKLDAQVRDTFFAQMEKQPLPDVCQTDKGPALTLGDLDLATSVADITLSHKFDSLSQYLHLNLDIMLSKLFAASVRFDVDTRADEFTRQQLKQQLPRLGGVLLSYEDQGYNRKVTQACGKALGIKADEVVNRQLDMLKQRASAKGLELKDELLAAYKDTLLPGVLLQFAIDFNHPLSMPEVAKPSDYAALAKQAKIQLQVNGHTVDGLPELLMTANQPAPSPLVAKAPDLKAQPQLPAKTVQKAPEPPVVVNKPAVKAMPAPSEPQPVSEPPPPRFVAVGVDQLSRYQGARVRVKTVNGHEMEGTLIKVLKNRFVIKRKISGGIAELPVVYKNVQQVEVQR